MTISLNNTIDDSSPLIEYQPEGAWMQGNETDPMLNGPLYFHESYTRTWQPGASASFSFNGTSIQILGVKRNGYGNFSITLDGVEVQGPASANGSDSDPSTVELFTRTGMEQAMHTVVLTNNPYASSGIWTGVDIDRITWTSDIDFGSSSSDGPSQISTASSASDAASSSTMRHMYHNTDSAFNWLPDWAWGTDENVADSGQSTSMSGASVNLTFTGQVIKLYGPTGPNYTSSYTVSKDGTSTQTFSANKALWNPRQLLYYADNLGPGNHTVVIVNEPGSGDSSGGIEGRQVAGASSGAFGVDYAEVWQANLAASPTVVTTPSTSSPSPSSTGINQAASHLGAGAIVGISLASVAFVFLLGLLWLLNRRNKTLWMRLQKGYMVQSQLDSHSPSPPRGRRSGIRSLFHLSLPSRTGIEPYPLTLGSGNTSENSAGIRSEGSGNAGDGGNGRGKYTPYMGFGRSSAKSSSKESSEALSSSESSDSGGYESRQPYPTTYHAGTLTQTPAPPEMRSTDPSRSGTMLSASTLVAEDGSDATSYIARQQSEKAARVLSHYRKTSRANVAPPSSIRTSTGTGTNSSASTLPFQQQRRWPKTPTSATTPTPASIRFPSGGVRNSVRRSYTSRSSRSRRRTHSTSPSRAQLFSRDAGDSSDSGHADDGYEPEDTDLGVDFYADEAFYEVSSPTRSLTRSQSDAQTPIRGWEEEEVRLHPVPWRLSRGARIETVNQERRDTDESLPPAYTSRRASLVAFADDIGRAV